MIPTCVVDAAHGPPPYLLTRNEVRVHRCARCGTIMADVAFEHEQYESDAYYSMKFKTKDEIDRYWGMRWRHVLAAIRRRTRPDRLLDVGAGNGYFVHLARSEFGWDATGLEISEKETAFAASVLGTDLKVELLDEHAARDYSTVTLFNVVEHVPDPLKLLEEAFAHVRPGGTVVVTTPNPSCIQARVKGLQRWGMIQPPHHINLFTRESLGALIERAGFRPVHYETLSTYMEWLWKYDTHDGRMRRILFDLFRWTRLGADHFFIAQRPAEPR
jgi:2-polyprenyl-3-methyl-5-hydroxy-6-metoxy-1,4-benzoquinol methylase